MAVKADISQRNTLIVSFFLASLLHVLLLGSLVVAFDWTKRNQPTVPLAIRATIVTDVPVVTPPREIAPEPVVEPEPEPVVDEPDPAELERARLEEEKRRQDALAEQERIRREAEAEAERVRQQQLEEQRRREEQERLLEEKRRQAELERQRQIEEQRRKNEELRAAEEEAQRQAALEAEMAIEAARNSDDMVVYMAQIQQHVQRNWNRPGTARDDLECLVNVTQNPGGYVVSVRIASCNGGEAVERSIVAAVESASPLPLPSNPVLFLRNFQFRFTIPE